MNVISTPIGFGGGGGSAFLDKLDATAAPTVNDDSDDGYSIGSRWFNLVTDKAYTCLDTSVGAADWPEISNKDLVIASETYAETINLNIANKDVVDITLTGAATVNLSGGVDGQSVVLRIRQDATGSRIITWGTMIRFSTDVPEPTLSTAVDALDYLAFRYNSTDSKYDLMAENKGF